jgi:hypothetical protein
MGAWLLWFFSEVFHDGCESGQFSPLAVSPGLGNNAMSWEMPFRNLIRGNEYENNISL